MRYINLLLTLTSTLGGCWYGRHLATMIECWYVGGTVVRPGASHDAGGCATDPALCVSLRWHRVVVGSSYQCRPSTSCHSIHRGISTAVVNMLLTISLSVSVRCSSTVWLLMLLVCYKADMKVDLICCCVTETEKWRKL